MSEQIEIVEMQPQFIALVKTRTTPETIGDDHGRCFQQVMAYLKQQAVEPAGPPLNFYYEMQSETVWNIGAGFPVARQLDGDDTVEVVEIPAGTAATMLHVGSYDGLAHSWKAFEVWHKEQGYKIGSEWLAWESYLTRPEDEPDESKWQVRLYWML